MLEAAASARNAVANCLRGRPIERLWRRVKFRILLTDMICTEERKPSQSGEWSLGALAPEELPGCVCRTRKSNEFRGKSKHQNPAGMRQDGTQATPKVRADHSLSKNRPQQSRLSGERHRNRVIGESPAPSIQIASKELHVLVASPALGPGRILTAEGLQAEGARDGDGDCRRIEPCDHLSSLRPWLRDILLHAGLGVREPGYMGANKPSA